MTLFLNASLFILLALWSLALFIMYYPTKITDAKSFVPKVIAHMLVLLGGFVLVNATQTPEILLLLFLLANIISIAYNFLILQPAKRRNR